MGTTTDPGTRFLYTVDRSSWLFLIATIFISYTISAVFFGLVYYLMENYLHWGNAAIYSTKHCIYHVEVDSYGNISNGNISFVGTIQFAFETQSTIGYGHHYVIDDCLAAVFVVWCQYISVNIVLAPIMAGLVFRKILRPTEVQEQRISQGYVYGVMTKVDDLARNVERKASIVTLESRGSNDLNDINW